ncbi:MAG TPA: hypothetical protein VH257_18880 [Chloroflexota bacterium]|nr:hypothetical protein [Chloroflexota bacterium]
MEAGVATPAYLTAALRRAGALPRGEVLAVGQERSPAFNSAVTHLRLTYSPAAPPSAPRGLVLKRNHPSAWGARAGAREVAFYRLVATPQAPQGPGARGILVPCIEAAHDAPAEGSPEGGSHLLLEDLSLTHRPPRTRGEIVSGQAVPPLAQAEAVVDALARFHGAWWDHSLLDGGAIRLSPWCADPAAYDDLTTSRRQDWERFLEAEGGWFPADLRALYESVLAAAPLLRGRSFPRRRQRTLTHNDCYFSNWLSPLRPASGPPRLIDWQSPEVSPGPFDLVPLLATFVTPDQRREGGFEARLLRRYHAGLVAAGVQDYSWEDCHDDYRLGIADYWLFYPIWDEVNGSGRDYWWPKLRCLVGAYRDLECAALLSG